MSKGNIVHALTTPLTEREHQLLIVEYNNSAAPYPADKSIVELFETQAAHTPEDRAVQLGDCSLSYRQLNERTNQMAGHLRSLGVGSGRLVTVYMEHSIEVVCAILAVLKAGAAYAPIDPSTTPEERLAFILQDISAGTGSGGALPVLITQLRLLSKVPQDTAQVVVLDSDFSQIECYATANPKLAASPRDLAYCIYTSGSTGKPKGVLIEHRSLVNYIWWANQKYCRGERLSWPLFSSLAFDLTVTSIFTPLISGGRIVVYVEDAGRHGTAILKVVEDRQVDIVKLTPSHLAMIKGMELDATPIRKLIVGGEDFKTDLACDVTNKFGRPVEIYNEYGPTEATVGCMIHHFDTEKDRGVSVPIGIPAANSGIYILDEQLNPVPAGEIGEMYLAGDGLARGYLNKPELTAQKFVMVKDPRQNGAATRLRMYKTGDLASWSADGRMEFLGRADYQVKIGGMRIELGEIESRLVSHPDVRECIVDVTRHGASEARPDGENEMDRLVAYYVSEKPMTVAEVRDHLAKELPEYMVPPYVVWLKKLPLTPNGKVDRQAMPVPRHEHMQPARDFVAPRTETEKALSLIWTELLRVENIGVDDDFFNLGGDSLLAIRAESRIRQQFGVNIGIQALFDNPTIAGLASVLDVDESPESAKSSASKVEARQLLVRMRPGTPERAPFFCLHGTGGDILNMRPLAMALPANLPFYCFQDKALDGSQPFESIEQEAACYVDEIRRVQPHSPYYIGGTCFGGLTAFEIARRLEESGEPVAALVLLDTMNPTFIKSLPQSERVLRHMRLILRRTAWHARKILMQRPSEWLGYITDRTKALREHMRSTREQGARLQAQMIEAASQTPLAENLKRIIVANTTALHNFVPKRYAGTVLIFRASARNLDSYDDPYLGWQSVVRGTLKTCEIEGDHMTMLEEPAVRVLAERVNAAFLELLVVRPELLEQKK
ncbi:MAG TPA: non-ribosomal peptide synthetase [Candidatus Polarisedimenticolia bacterium]|nr:non-ribosomal peptide synthetase [Candidatus Polarisedimenticolia bacterium]